MANNIKAGYNGVVAKSTISFVSAGLDNTNTEIIFLVDGAELKSWKPDRVINGITGYEANKGYYQISKSAIDLTAIVVPPISEGGGDVTAPTISSKTATNATTIVVVFSEVVTTSAVTGFSFRKNGSNLAASAVAGSGTNTLTFTVATMASGDTLDMSYNPATGNCMDASSNELATVTNSPVTNSIVSGATDLIFTDINSLTHTGNEWIGSGGASRAAGAGKIPSGQSGLVYMDYASALNRSCGLGLMTADGATTYTSFTYGVMPYTGTYQRLPSLTSLSVTATVGDKIGLRRTMSGGVGTVTIEKSTDNWTSSTVLYTYSGDVTGDLYPKISVVDADDKCTNPKGVNVV